MDDVERAVAAEIKALLLKGVTSEEVARAKQRMIAEAIYARDSLSGPANIFGAALVTNHPSTAPPGAAKGRDG